MDPYILKDSELDYCLASVPPVTYPDIAAYLVFGHSLYNNEQIKAFKSLEAYKYFESGFVLKAGTKIIENLHVFSRQGKLYFILNVFFLYCFYMFNCLI